MKLDHIVVATDASETSRHAYLTALNLAKRASAKVTVTRAIPGRRVPVGAYHDCYEDQRTGLVRWADVEPNAESPPVELHVEFGHPSIEIPRYAEAVEADLIVLGRKRRTQAARFREGDTADAVICRSRVPCLLVPPGSPPIERVLVATDATSGGGRILGEARDLARLIGAELRAVIVGSATRESPLFEQVLTEVRDSRADMLVIGTHGGGQAGVPALGGVARHLAHAAPCAVLTIPL